MPRQTKNIYAANLAAGATLQIASINSAAIKIRLVHFNAFAANIPGLTFIARDSSRTYKFVTSFGSGVMLQYWQDKNGDLRTAIELEHNVTFEIKNETALVASDVMASVLYDLTYEDQKP